MFCGLLLIWLPARLTSGNLATPIWVAILVLSGVLAVTLSWFAVGFLQANSALWRGDLDAVTSDEPLDTEPAGVSRAGARAGRRPWLRRWIWACVGILVGLFLLPPSILTMRRAGWRSSHAPAGIPPPPFVEDTSSALKSDAQFVLYTVPAQVEFHLGELHWNFKGLIPPGQFARISFIRWSNDVPVVETAACAYYEVGQTPADVDFAVACGPFTGTLSNVSTNTIRWNVSMLNHVTYSLDVPREGAYHPLATPSRLAVHSGHQGILGLADWTPPEGSPTLGRCGAELRIFLEPLKSPAIRTDPLEVEGPNYVSGYGPDWTMDEALKAIKQWPVNE